MQHVKYTHAFNRFTYVLNTVILLHNASIIQALSGLLSTVHNDIICFLPHAKYRPEMK